MSQLREKGKTKEQFFVSSLLQASRKILEIREFNVTARYIFDSCKDLIGATAGYVALLSKDGTENEVLFLDSGGLPCSVDTSLPMPIRGLRAEAYRTGKTVYDNNFSGSEWVKYIPERHVLLENVLFAPLVIEGKTAGLLGLANKPGGFTEDDARMATAFGELAAVALMNSRTMELLKTSEEKYRSLADNALVGIYKSNLKGEILYVNNALAEMLGFASPEKLISEGVIARYKNLEDRRVLIENLKKTGRVADFETEMIAKTGKTINVLLSAVLNNDILSGMVMDITTHKRDEEQLLKNHRELSALYGISSAISRTIDMDTLLNNILNTITGLDILDVERKAGIFIIEGEKMKLVSHLGHTELFLNSHKDMKVGDCLCGLAAKTGEIIISYDSGKDDRHTFRYPNMTPHGHIILPLKAKEKVVGVLYLYLPADVGLDNEKLKMLITAGDQIGMAIDHARLYEETKALSLHDPLTGLANRRLMNIIMERSCARTKRHGGQLSAVMVDIDYFKKYNDTYGHISGDKMLVDIANIILREIREIDIAVRYGGEEFLILFPETGVEKASKAAERIRKAVKAETEITVSLGVSYCQQGEKEYLINKADEALYLAKQNGRNRVEVGGGIHEDE
jgi:diguanylate cyclase (GGDEF)-like protein/PAS domain S-box-containing protein